MAEIILDKLSFFHNLDFYSSAIGKDKLCLALKDNAYGHGIEQVSLMAIEYGIKHCFVKNEQEAIKALKYNFETILILYPKTFDILDSRLVYSINSINDLDKIRLSINVEFKVDTGMGRNGLPIADIPLAIEKCLKKPLSIIGFFTHFASADTDFDFYLHQKSLFDRLLLKLKLNYGNIYRYHCCNTAALEINQPTDNCYDLYRLGIGAYGYSPCTLNDKRLKPVMAVYADLISSRELDATSRVGYGALGYKPEKNSVISNYDIGYGDGFFRLNENDSYIICQKLPVLGCVSMDSFSTFGNLSRVCVMADAKRLADYHQTIVYEILTNFKDSLFRTIQG